MAHLFYVARPVSDGHSQSAYCCGPYSHDLSAPGQGEHRGATYRLSQPKNTGAFPHAELGYRASVDVPAGPPFSAWLSRLFGRPGAYRFGAVYRDGAGLERASRREYGVRGGASCFQQRVPGAVLQPLRLAFSNPAAADLLY